MITFVRFATTTTQRLQTNDDGALAPRARLEPFRYEDALKLHQEHLGDYEQLEHERFDQVSKLNAELSKRVAQLEKLLRDKEQQTIATPKPTNAKADYNASHFVTPAEQIIAVAAQPVASEPPVVVVNPDYHKLIMTYEALKDKASAEIKVLKTRLASAQSEQAECVKDFDARVARLRQASVESVNSLRRKHAYEIDKLVEVLTGQRLSLMDSSELQYHNEHGREEDEALLFSDPLKVRSLLSLRDKQVSRVQALEECVGVTRRQLDDAVRELHTVRHKCARTEEANALLQSTVGRLLRAVGAKKGDTARGQLERIYEALNDKLGVLEQAKSGLGDRQLLVNTPGYFDAVISPTTAAALVSATFDDVDYSPLAATRGSCSSHDQQLVRHLQDQLSEKNSEILKFRQELDKILQFLHSLKKH